MVNFSAHKNIQEKLVQHENGNGLAGRESNMESVGVKTVEVKNNEEWRKATCEALEYRTTCCYFPSDEEESQFLVVTTALRVKGNGCRVKDRELKGFVMRARIKRMRCSGLQEAPLDNEWNVRASPLALESRNPIRELLESLNVAPSHGKEKISLAQGDPTAFGHLRAPQAAVDAMVAATESYMFNGYTHSAGSQECRMAVADYHSPSLPFKLSANDICITVGCSQAIQLCIAALAMPGANMLLPRPGFPIYETFCKYYGVQCHYYDLIPEKDWEIDLDEVTILMDANTVAWIICNPSNPCGSVYKYQHLAKIAAVAEKQRVPIISDEIYADMVFGDCDFIPLAIFSPKVPVLTVGGVSKRWLVPGWRLGWIIVADPKGILAKARVMEALTKLMQMTIGTSTLTQAAISGLLLNTPSEFYDDTLKSLKAGAELCYRRAQCIKGLDCPTFPQGAMYIMVRINPGAFKGLNSDVEFSSLLVEEESVIVLPGAAFGIANWIRVVFATPQHLLEEAWDRIELFCLRHSLQH